MENAFAKLKAPAQGRRACVEVLWHLIGKLIDAFSPQEYATSSPPQAMIQIKLKILQRLSS